MKLTLKNIRQHKSATLDAPDKGIVRIKGPSGRGKTTFLDAIRHALYGDVTGLTHWEETSSKIDLEWLGMKLVRSNRPNAVRLTKDGVEYVDDQAESEIHKLLGMDSEEFVTSSYIQQEFADSLLTLSPADQLRLIQRLAFGDDDPEVTKVKIKVLIIQKELALKLSEKDVNAAVEEAKRTVQDLIQMKPFADTPRPEEPEDGAALEAEKVRRHGLVAGYKKQIQSCRDQLNSKVYGLVDQLKTKEAVLAKVELLNMVAIQDALARLNALPESVDTVKLQDRKKELEGARAYFTLMKEVTQVSAEIEGRYVRQDKSKKLMDFLAEREGVLTRAIAEQKRYCKATEDRLSDIVRAKDSLECPSCNAALQYVGGELVLHDHDIAGLLKEEQILSEALTEARKTIHESEDKKSSITTDLAQLTRLRDRAKATQKPSVKSETDLTKELEDITASLDAANLLDFKKSTEQRDIRSARDHIERAQEEVHFLKTAIEKYGDFLKREEVEANLADAQRQMDEESSKLVEVMGRIADREKALSTLNVWEDVQERYKEAQKWAREAALAVKKVDAAHKILQEELAAAIRLKEISDKAALEAIASVFSSINFNAQPYIEAMFPETGTLVQLRNKKELKSGEERSKPSLHIYHKGSVTNGWKDLSGGEKARIKLAFHLALSDLYQSPILLIDEPFQGLGAEDRQLAFDVLENISHNKLVMIVEHNMEDSQADFVFEA